MPRHHHRPYPRGLARVSCLGLAVLVGAGCGAPATQAAAASSEAVAPERATEAPLALRAHLDDQRRVDDVAYPLLRSAVPLCGASTTKRAGMRLGNSFMFPAEWQPAARAMRLGDTTTVLDVARGSGAARAGLRAGDRVLRLADVGIDPGRGAAASIERSLETVAPSASVVKVDYVREGRQYSAMVPLDTVCAYDVLEYESNARNVFSDGRRIHVTSGMLRVVTDDELAIVLSHEIAHHAMRHVDASDLLFEGPPGSVVDVVTANPGVSDSGQLATRGMDTAAVAFSPDFEREADYVGLYIMALAGEPVDGVASFWRRMATADPRTIRFAFTHPTSTELAERVQRWAAEIDRKVANGEPVRPDLKPGTTLGAATWRPAARVAMVQDGEVVPAHAPALADAPAPAAAPTRTSPAPRRSPPAGASDRAVTAAVTNLATPAATVIIGPPRSEADRAAAAALVPQCRLYLGSHEWGNAESCFRRTVLLDGSVAAYHGGLGTVLLVEARWAEAEASLSAAVLIDPDNADYRRMLAEARSHR